MVCSPGFRNGTPREKSALCRRPAIAAIVCAECTWSISLQNKNPSKGHRLLFFPARGGEETVRVAGNVAIPPKQKSRPCIQHAGTGQKSNPAVPPGLTQMRPTHPYHHTVALFTECRSVAHRAGTPPSDCPPKSIHTIRSVPRSQLCAALCDIQGSVTCSSSTVSTAL